MRRLLPSIVLLFARPASPAQQHDDRSPTFPKFESSAHVSDKCMACARILDCLKEGLLPRLRHLQEVKRRSYSKSKYQRLGAVGGLEEIIEEEVERLCVWPRIFHDQDVRTACEKLTTDHDEEVVDAISGWAKETDYGVALKPEKGLTRPEAPPPEKKGSGGDEDDGGGEDEAAEEEEEGGEAAALTELRAAVCGEELKQCDHKELVELVRVADVEEKKKNHDVTHKLGRDREMPYESEVPFHKQEGATIVKMVAEDFVERVIENGAKSDVLVYFYFPGRRLPEFGGVVDSHARMRPKYHKLAQLIDPAASNGSILIAWIDCVQNTIPYPWGNHVHGEKLAIFPAVTNDVKTRGNKFRPRFLHNMRDGEIDLPELLDFVVDASERMSTKRHVQGRRIELGERALREAIHFSSYRAAIEIDEWMLPPLNLTAIRERFENPEGTMLGAPVRHAELAAPPKKPPKDEV